MSNRVTISVYKGRNSPRTITVTLNGEPINFVSAGVTKLGVVLDGVEYFSTDNFLSYEDGGKVTFKLGGIGDPPRKSVTGLLMMYSSEYPLGKPILTEESDFQLDFTFI